MCFKQLHYLGQTPTRQCNVVGKILAARDYSRLVKCGKPHRLCLIEFRILKCGQPEQPVQSGRISAPVFGHDLLPCFSQDVAEDQGCDDGVVERAQDGDELGYQVYG